jgi:hypothetical protein
MVLRAANDWFALLLGLTTSIWMLLRMAGVEIPFWGDLLFLIVAAVSVGLGLMIWIKGRRERPPEQ